MKIKKTYFVTILICLPVVLMMCKKPGTFLETDIPLLNANDEQAHNLGDAAVEQSFVTAPAPINSGLGPIFSNVSCVSCHHNDGKGSPTAGQVNSSLLLRLSILGEGINGEPLPIPGFGGQLQDVAVFGRQPEAKVDIQYTYQTITLPDGTIVELRKPTYKLLNPYLPLPATYFISPRMAPPFFGLGLLQNIDEQSILAYADENDANADGISGKPNYVWDATLHKTTIGRFGLKANTATILTQVAAAYQQDMGITNSVFPLESSHGQFQADGLPDDYELPDSILHAAAFYIKTLAVPARRNVSDETIIKGEQLFKQINCSNCHIPTLQTKVDVTLPATSNQRIHPYTDLLLHDMGNGLADGRPDFLANGNEWKTPALWGIGLFPKTNGTPFYLHDGRARSILEAILWHGGEATASKNKVLQLSTSDRNALVKFINSL
jgi:CxxC motif-containing protein (DUF1111 family)